MKSSTTCRLSVLVSRRGRLGASALALFLILSGCSGDPEAERTVDETPSDAVVPAEPTRTPPPWTQPASLSPVDSCKVEDGQPSNTRGVMEGTQVNGVRVRSNVGFPVSEGTLPIVGEANLIVAMVSFDDAPRSELTPQGFLAPQLEQITQWSEFWSQGTFRYTFQMVDEWVNVPVNHADYPVHPRVDQEASRRNAYEVARLVTEALPDDLDYEKADGILIYWSPGIDEFSGDIGLQGFERGMALPTPQGPKGMFFWSGNKWHYTPQGTMTAEVKASYTWSFWIYLMLDAQGLHNHGPGNGWPNGPQQLQVGLPEFSGALLGWDSFRMGWTRDEQVHCVLLDDLTEPVQVMLTPQEIYGGERKLAVIPVSASDVLVVESRRPVGYSATWDSGKSGVLVYSVNPMIAELDSRVGGGCGDDPAQPKWAFYLYPDNAGGDCRDFSTAFVREGDTITHEGLTISLEFSDDDLDYVTIDRLAPAQ